MYWKNLRPVSNLPFLSEILEKVVLHQFFAHLQENDLCNPFQSAYRTGHSTVTALLQVVNDLLIAMHEDNISVLLLLDLSAVFDTIDHQILLSRLETVFGIRFTALQWFRSYLLDRNQSIVVNNSASSSLFFSFDVWSSTGLGAGFCTNCLVHYSTFRRHGQSFSQPSVPCRWHPTSKISSTKQHTKPCTWPAVLYIWYKITDVQQSAQT